MFYSRIVPIFAGALVLSAAASAQVPIRVQVLTATVNLSTHALKIELQNQCDKPVTAYALDITQFDASGNPVGQPESTGVDLLSNADGLNAPGWEEILPGAIAAFPVSVVARPETASAEAVVTGAVYADRTSEGKAAMFFAGRANDAKEARAAIALLKPYPTTPQAVKSALQNLRGMTHGIGLSVFADQMHLSGEAAGALFSKEQPVPDMGVPSKQNWDGIVSKLENHAAFLEAQSTAK